MTDSSSANSEKKQSSIPDIAVNCFESNYESNNQNRNSSHDTEPAWLTVIEADDIKYLSSAEKTVIALIDSGIDTENRYLYSTLWINRGEIPYDGIDNDGNGYIDDINGWNFGDNNGIVDDFNGHGTAVAGIVLRCAVDAQLMILKVSRKNSSYFTDKAIVEAIYYAVYSGADVINLSLSLAEKNDEVEEAIKFATGNKVLIVNSAARDMYGKISFPGTLDEVITVGAVSENGSSTLWQSPSDSAIDIVAPGESVQSMSLGGGIAFFTGTSFSAPMVTGAIATLHGMNRSLKPATLKNIIFRGAKDLGDTGKDIYYGWGLLSGSGIKKISTPSIEAVKIENSTQSTIILKQDSFSISCYLPPTDSLTTIYIALKRDFTGPDATPGNLLWSLDINGEWNNHDKSGIMSVCSIPIGDTGFDSVLFDDTNGIWKNFSPFFLPTGAYRIGIAITKNNCLLAPLFWSDVIFVNK